MIGFNQKILENEYREFIRMFLEKTTYFLITVLKELNKNSAINESKLQIETINSSTLITAPNGTIEGIKKNKTVSRICTMLAFHQRLIIGEIPLENAFIKHSKIGEKDIESFKLRMSPLETRMDIKIQQEWGSSKWKIEAYIDNNSKIYIYCEEIGKYKMSFFFNQMTI